MRQRLVSTVAFLALGVVLVSARPARAAASCPIELGAIEDAKPNKLYLYFPAAADATYPEFGGAVDPTSPATAFNVADLASYTGTAADLQNAIRDVVIDDYCEFNVKILTTTTTPPTTFARRSTVAIGTDSIFFGTAGPNCGAGPAVPPCLAGTPPCYLFGTTQAFANPGFARVWAGTYQTMLGGAGGQLNGANSTLERWAFAIGGTAAHEGGHTYGLTHANGETVKPGEDPIGTHIMPRGCALTDDQRASARRHFDDTSFSILASNVGLSVQTIHNWDFINPNSTAASKLQITILSTQATLTPSWTYLGNLSPWDVPTVTPAGTASFQGTSFNKFLVTWSTAKAWANGTPGNVGPGVTFHVGTTFSGVDLSLPNPIILTQIALQDGTGTALELQPRMIGYDAGLLDGSDGNFNFRFFNPDPARPLILANLAVQELPRVASIDSMVPGAALKSWQGLPIVPWQSAREVLPGNAAGAAGDRRGQVTIRDVFQVALAKLSQARHIFIDVKPEDCKQQAGKKDGNIDDTLCTPGITVDLFPATTMYVTATVIDPAAKHWDPVQGKFIVGPIESRLFYQVAGRHPDLNKNGIDDAIDIYRGTSKDLNHDGVPDEVQGGGTNPPGGGAGHHLWWLWLLLLLLIVIVLFLWLRR
ncbi:MAG TPA: hypothetical protein VOA87_03725 [Thermoanaerobaculia bacterium]|nr:hypothetical protein [Thermoanaerobaculia bacterium]